MKNKKIKNLFFNFFNIKINDRIYKIVTHVRNIVFEIQWKKKNGKKSSKSN